MACIITMNIHCILLIISMHSKQIGVLLFFFLSFLNEMFINRQLQHHKWQSNSEMTMVKFNQNRIAKVAILIHAIIIIATVRQWNFGNDANRFELLYLFSLCWHEILVNNLSYSNEIELDGLDNKRLKWAVSRGVAFFSSRSFRLGGKLSIWPQRNAHIASHSLFFPATDVSLFYRFELWKKSHTLIALLVMRMKLSLEQWPLN